jgi:hypothetical protein
VGRVVRLGLCRPGARADGSERVSSLMLDALGVVGDRHAGATLRAGPRQRGVPRGTVLPNTRQVSLVSVEESALLAAALGLPHLDFTWLGANVEVDGVAAFTRLPPRALLRFEGGVVLRLEGENEPCRKAGRWIEAASGRPVEAAFVKAARGRRGVVGWVEHAGVLTEGERFEVSRD